MNKFCFCLLLLIVMVTAGYAQAPDTLLKNKRYNAMAVNGAVQELQATGDSLIVTFRKDSVITGKDFYKIVAVRPRGAYTMVMVKMDPRSLTLVTPKGKRQVTLAFYGVFIFRFDKEGIHLMVLHDGRLWLTAREAENTYEAVRLQGEYFNTWYPADRFERFSRYPRLLDADSVKVQKVAMDWVIKLIEHRAKKMNTYSTDKYGADYGRDNFTKVLVNNHLSPLGTPGDFTIKLKQYHLKFAPEKAPNPRDSTATRDKSLPQSIAD